MSVTNMRQKMKELDDRIAIQESKKKSNDIDNEKFEKTLKFIFAGMFLIIIAIIIFR